FPPAGSSSPSVTSRTRACSTTGWRRRRPGTSRPCPAAPGPTRRASSPAATCRTRCTGRPSPPPAPAAWQPSRRSASSCSTPRKPADVRTRAIHAGSRLPDSNAIPITPAIHTAAVSWFDSSDELDAALDGQDFVYTRIRGENPVLLEEAVAALEGAEASAVFGSGMAALRSVFDAQGLVPGDRVVLPADGYGATRALFKRLADQQKVELFPLKLSDPAAIERFVAIRPKLVLAESMTNPLLAVPDLPSIAHAAHAAGAALLVDGTFTSPALQRTLSQGADYALHSTT